MQRECFDADFRANGPSILRSVEVWFQGWKRYHASDSAYLRAKAERWKLEIHDAWPLFRVAKRFGPTPEAAAQLEAEVKAALGPPSLGPRVRSFLAPFAAAWTRFTLRHNLFQHPKLVRNTYRTGPDTLRSGEIGALNVSLERLHHKLVIKLDGLMDRSSALQLAACIRDHLRNNDAEIALVIAEGTAAPGEIELLKRKLKPFIHRVSFAETPLPSASELLMSA